MEIKCIETNYLTPGKSSYWHGPGVRSPSQCAADKDKGNMREVENGGIP